MANTYIACLVKSVCSALQCKYSQTRKNKQASSTVSLHCQKTIKRLALINVNLTQTLKIKQDPRMLTEETPSEKVGVDVDHDIDRT